MNLLNYITYLIDMSRTDKNDSVAILTKLVFVMI